MIFKDIEGTKGLYLISDTGLVKSLPRKVKCGKSFMMTKERIMKEQDNGKGYKFVYILGKHCYIHRLVASAFIPNYKNKRTVNHKNGIKSDNMVGNLEWATDSENNKHSYEVLKRPTLKNNPKVSYPVLKLDKNNNVLEEYPSTREADRANNISGVYRVCKGERKTCGGYNWKYKGV